jgi:hypothetical protein
MYISFALFADAANLSQEGKLNILGVFDAVQVGDFPTVHPRTTLVLRLKAEAADVGTHRLGLRWLSPEGEELWSTEGEINVGGPADAGGEVDLPLIAVVATRDERRQRRAAGGWRVARGAPVAEPSVKPPLAASP